MQIYERLNLNNPIQETDRFRSVGSEINPLFSVLKGRDMDTIWQKSVIRCIRTNSICTRIYLSNFRY